MRMCMCNAPTVVILCMERNLYSPETIIMDTAIMYVHMTHFEILCMERKFIINVVLNLL